MFLLMTQIIQKVTMMPKLSLSGWPGQNENRQVGMPPALFCDSSMRRKGSVAWRLLKWNAVETTRLLFRRLVDLLKEHSPAVSVALLCSLHPSSSDCHAGWEVIRKDSLAVSELYHSSCDEVQTTGNNRFLFPCI